MRRERTLPKILQDAEVAVERERNRLLGAVHLRPDVALYLLASAAEARFDTLAGRLIARPHILHLYARQEVSGLGFAVSWAWPALPAGAFVAPLITSTLEALDWKRAVRALDFLAHYANLRDAFLTFLHGGYDVTAPRPGCLRFSDSPGWSAHRDLACQALTQEVEEDMLRRWPPLQLSGEGMLAVARREVLDNLTLPHSFDLGGVSVGAFIELWTALTSQALRPQDGLGCDVLYRTDLVARLRGRTGLTSREVERFVDLLTRKPGQEGPLTLFHCPLIQNTSDSLIIASPALLFGRPTACIPRLAIHRGPGIGSASRGAADILLAKLQRQFAHPGVVMKAGVAYEDSDDRGDIDLVLYEPARALLLLAQLKAFVPPDSVEEVVRANGELEAALSQVARVRLWLTRNGSESVLERIGVSRGATVKTVRHVVLGHGFIGSDYLAIPHDVSVVDVRYLLMERFHGTSLVDAVDAFDRKLKERLASPLSAYGVQRFRLASFEVEMPAASALA